VKTLLVSLAAKYVHATLAPYCLLAGIRRFGQAVTDAEILSATVNEADSVIYARIAEYAPDAVAFSTYIWNIEKILSLSRRIRRENPTCRIILGGPEVSCRAEELLRGEPAIDAVISGEGELALAALLDAMAEGRSLSGIPGVSAREGDAVFSSPPGAPLPVPPSPLEAGYAEALNGRIAYYETSRGCPFRCSFCLSGGEDPVRFFPEERAVGDLIRLANAGCRTVKLVDRTFNADRARARRIFERLIDGCGVLFPRGVTFHFELEGRLLDEETLALLERAPAGLFQFELGLQSTNAETLAAIGRATDTASILSATRRLVASGRCHVHLDLIAGLPLESEESFYNGFREAYAARPHMLQIGILKLLSGSRLSREQDRFRASYSRTPPYEVIKTQTMSEATLRSIASFGDAFDRFSNSGRFRRTLDYLIQDAGLDPVWIFLALSRSLLVAPAPGLDALTERIVEIYGAAPGVDRERLVDHMLCDRLATNPDRHLPISLRRPDPAIGRIRQAVEGAVRRNAARLSDGRIVLAVYLEKDSVTAEYPLIFIEESEVIRNVLQGKS
jgi:hypothetical protein